MNLRSDHFFSHRSVMARTQEPSPNRRPSAGTEEAAVGKAIAGLLTRVYGYLKLVLSQTSRMDKQDATRNGGGGNQS